MWLAFDRSQTIAFYALHWQATPFCSPDCRGAKADDPGCFGRERRRFLVALLGDSWYSEGATLEVGQRRGIGSFEELTRLS